MTETYDYSVKLMDKTIKFRKWKVKDKTKFLNNTNDKKLIKEALVYDCLEDKKIALSEDEYNFMLIHIRETSLSDKVTYIFNCDSCGVDFEYEANLKEIITPEFKPYGDIISGKHIFTMGKIRNRDFYQDMMIAADGDEAKYLIDFISHIHAYNDQDGLTFEQLNNVINELDVDIFEKIFYQWENMRFKTNNTHDVACDNCGHKTLYEFDDLPGFFPTSWEY